MEESTPKDNKDQFTNDVKPDVPAGEPVLGQTGQKPAPAPGKTPPVAQPLRIRLLRWTIGVLVLFALGLVTAIFLLYLPLRQEANRLQSQLAQTAGQLESQTKLSAEHTASLQSEIDRLSQVESQNTTLQAQLEEQQLHSAILAARMDVSAAQLALSRTDPARVRLAFVKTPETWDLISSRLQADQRGIVDDLRSLMELALNSAEGEPAAAEAALDQLSASLIELENAYFARP